MFDNFLDFSYDLQDSDPYVINKKNENTKMFCQHSFKIKDTLWCAYNSRQMQLQAFFFLFYTTLHKVRGSGNV